MLRPEYLCWKPDYEEYYFVQLRKRAVAWFLFREEFLFVLPGAIISEIPMAGRATYVFALPSDRENFLRLYERASRNEIRQTLAMTPPNSVSWVEWSVAERGRDGSPRYSNWPASG